MRFSLFEGAVSVEHRGTSWGDSSLRAPDALSKLEALRVEHGLRDVVLPQLNFEHHIAAADSVEPVKRGAPELLKARVLGDGYLLDRVERGVFIANGDCAVGVLYAGGRAVVMHLGLGCLWRADGGPVLIEQAVELLGGARASLQFWVGCGIGPCCHGYAHDRLEHLERARFLRARFGEDVIQGAAQHGPRRGQVAYDHVLMAVRSARSLGVERVLSDRLCRACAGLDAPDEPGYGDYFSNTRDAHRGLERNTVLVWMPQ